MCLLRNGDKSICHTRVNIGNKLYTIAYGNPCTVHVDPIEKKPLFHFLPSSRSYSIATAGCTLACLNCQNWEISQVSPNDTTNYDLFPTQVVEEAIKNSCQSIAYTYSEPLAFYEYTYDTAKLAKAKGLKNLLISNGYINEKPLRDLAKHLHGANINLKSFSDDIYMRLNGGKLQPILDTLKILKEENVWLEITNLIVPTWTDNIDMIKKMSDWLVKNGLYDYPLHFIRFHPMYKLTQLPETPVSILEKARDIAMKAGMKYVYVGNVPGHQAENTYCHKCKKMIIERRGFAIISNNITNGHCKFCNEKLPGIWT
jgi:pyruvate formate lyase activating enzyme